MTLRNVFSRRIHSSHSSSCRCRRTSSKHSVVNEMLLSDWRDALAHNMEIESWTADELQSAFELPGDEYEVIEERWRRSWEHLGRRMHCVLNEKLESLPAGSRQDLDRQIAR